MRGKVIYLSKTDGVFVQMDKNNQICDLLSFNRKAEYEKRIGERIFPEVLNMYRGRPLYTNFLSLVSELTTKYSNEKA